MKVLYISTPSFLDADLSYIRSLSNKIDVVYLMDLAPTSLKKTVLNIDKQIKNSDILPADNYAELQFFTDYMNCDSYVINRTVGKFLSLETLKMYFKIKKFIKQHNPDLIHYNNTVNLGILGCLANNYKKIITIHDPIPHIGDDNFTTRLVRKINFFCVKKYILLNQNQKEPFLKKYNIASSNTYCSKLGVYDYYTHYYDSKIDENKSNKTVLFFGRIATYKGIDVLLKSFAQVREKFIDAKLIIAGSGTFNFDEFDTTQVTIINRYIETDELFTLIKNSSFVICPYLEGTQSGVVMTSFSMYKPVIVTNVGGLSEMVTNKETGLIIEPNNDQALSNAIVNLFENPNKLELFSKNIKANYFNQGEFSWNTISDDLVKVYKSLLQT